MQLSELITEARSLINQTDSNNSQITNTQLTTWANEGYRAIVARIGELPETEYELTSATGDMSTNTDILTMLRAYMYRPSSGEYEKLTIIGVDKLENIDEGWLSADTNIPIYLVRKSTHTVYLYPQPDSDNTSQTIKLFAIAFPTSLSADEDVPDLPKNLQDLIPHYMAWRSLKQMGQEDKANTEIIFFNLQLKAQRQISTKFSGQQNRFQWTGRDDA